MSLSPTLGAELTFKKVYKHGFFLITLLTVINHDLVTVINHVIWFNNMCLTL